MRIRHFLHRIKCILLYENKVTPAVYKLLCKLRAIRPVVIFYMDGGICSQMHQYLLGQYYAKQGYHVAFDLGWYQRNGMDNDRRFERIFEFTQMWPTLPFEIASPGKIAFYSRQFHVKRNGMHFPLAVTPPPGMSAVIISLIAILPTLNFSIRLSILRTWNKLIANQ